MQYKIMNENEAIIPVKRSPVFIDGVTEMAEGWEMDTSLLAFSTTMEHALETISIGVGLVDMSASGKVLVEGAQAKTVVTAAMNTNDVYHYQLRPDQFFIHTLPYGEGTILNVLNRLISKPFDVSSGLVTATDMTHGWAELLLVGKNSADLLSRVCALDFHESEFPDMTAKFSSVAKTRQLIIRRDIVLEGGLNKMPAYAIIGARSYATYLWQTLLQAGRNDQLAPIGYQTLLQLTNRA